MLLPGPEAQQLATYIGWLLHRTAGGIMAGGLFILPGVISIMALSYIYAGYGNVSFVEALFFGLKAAVLAIVIQAVVRVGKRALRNRIMIGAGRRGLHRDLLFQRAVPDHHHCRRRDRIFRRKNRTAGICRRGAWRRQERRGRRQHARRRIARPCPPDRSARAESQRGLAAAVAGAGRCAADRVRTGQCVQPDRGVLQQDGDGDVRRRLCGAGLCRAAGGRALSLGAARAKCSTASAWPRPRRAR